MQCLTITILSDSNSWINNYIPYLVKKLKEKQHVVKWIYQAKEIPQGDLVFCLGCGQILSSEVLKRNSKNLIVHESALPQGKGWSPLTWQILEGNNEIPITLFEAEESVDSGKIYLQSLLKFQGNELVDELRKTQAEKSIEMCLKFVQRYPEIIEIGKEQSGDSTYYPRRKPKDSRLDPERTIKEQFNLLRVVDNERYPAFFELNGEVYILKIVKKHHQ
ncbi:MULTISPECIES: formyltransferase family protein [unclassified Moorena]|uniref:formyltransferase family protein n=1 Tax=unclassified Moorena TaxID=2683338 RepID=UPI0013FFF076|nr:MULTISPECIES: formyltransferase family protein [unclassified Moorena]NEO12173.1 methionyl-tRNA formyltransferase [Moorena sp. SIO3E8]NEO82310.1 methionyl-tRNA formyltransferase [Moorena sp. SIO4G3]NEQ00913.1 methionyl-tRNA formyltransferase [Moorena sp. SIO3F7]